VNVSLNGKVKDLLNGVKRDLGSLSLVSLPFTLEADILPETLSPNNELVLRMPFVVRFTFKNHTDRIFSLHVQFESSDAFLLAGSKESTIRIFNEFVHTVDQTYVSLAAGSLPFPRVFVRCTDLCDPELDSSHHDSLIAATNQLIQDHILKSLPQTLFIMP